MQIKELRESSGLLQKEVAYAVGVSPAAVWKWEQGKAAPSFNNLQALAALFGCSLDALAGKLPPDDPPSRAAS